MCVCVYSVCIYMCVYVYMRVCVCGYACMYVRVCMHVYIYMDVQNPLYVYKHMYAFVCGTYACMHKCMHIYCEPASI